MNYHNISYPDMNNGEGLRVVLWLSGCSHKCKGCQNPQTWDCNSGIKFDKLSKKELFEQIEKDYISGITFSGGDPLNKNNINEVKLLIEEIILKYPNKNIWLYTGYTYEEIKNDKTLFEIIKLCDILVDGKYIEDLRNINLHWVGSSNQRVINIKETLKTGEIELYKG